MTPQQAYEEDVRRMPQYYDGSNRPAWDTLCAITRWSWERNPTPRDWTMGYPMGDERDNGRLITAERIILDKKRRGLT